MKKIISAVLACNLAYSYAQITLTKDLSFGNNGEYIYPYTGSYATHKLLGDKILVCFNYSNPGSSAGYSKFIRLNSNGSLDLSFGTNGEFTDGGNPGSPDTMYYGTEDYLITASDSKYFSSGTFDNVFMNNWGINSINQKKYLHILSDGKMIFRKDANFTKILSDGALDTSYGTNGSITTVPYSVDYYQGLVVGNFAYEFGTSTAQMTNGIRKINTTTGSLDLSYGNGGYGNTSIIPSMLINSIPHQIDNSMINFIYNDGTGQYSLSKTNSNGLLDANFGNSGVFQIPPSINSIPYTLESSSYKTQGSGNVFLLVESNNTNDYEIISYSFSGNLQTINALQTFPTGFNRYDFYPYPTPYTYRIETKDNYIYLFTPTKIIKYIISNSTLSVSENADKNDLVQFANPFGDQLLLNTNEKIKSIDIYDEGGRLVLRNKSSKNIDTSGLNQGAYFIKVTTESNQIISRKGIKN